MKYISRTHTLNSNILENKTKSHAVTREKFESNLQEKCLSLEQKRGTVKSRTYEPTVTLKSGKLSL